MGIQKEIENKYIIGQPKNKGIVAMPLVLDYGESQKVISLQAHSNFKEILGYSLGAPQLILLKEAFKRAKQILIYKLNTGEYAICRTAHLTLTAKHPGTRGNALTVAIIPYKQWQNWGQVSKDGVIEDWGQVSKDGVIEDWGQVSKDGVMEEWGQVSKDDVRYVVVTKLEGEVVDLQAVNEIGEIRENGYVRFEVEDKSWEVDEAVVFKLEGGMDYKVGSKEWKGFFEVIRRYEWRAMAITVEERKVKKKVTEFIKELREVEGRGVYAVMAHYGEANHVGVISIANGVKLVNGIQLTRNECAAWLAGVVASAGVKYNEEMLIYEEAVGSDTRLNKAQVNKLVEEGHIVFVKRRNVVEVAEDINTFKQFTPKWGEAYRRNAFVRMIDVMKYDLHRMMKVYYLGSIKRGKGMQESKACFKEICVRYMEMLQNKQVLYEVNPMTDIDVFLAEDMRGVDISLVLRDSETDEKTYVSILYNKLIG